ncbi:MAG: hypothetical protein NVS2B9_18240 [Myxococcales bacterium]
MIAAVGLGSAGARGQTAPPASADPVESRQASPARSGQAGERGEGAARTSKRTVLHFEDDSIRGDLTRPDGELVQAPRRVAEGSLVRLRKSFTDRALGGAVRGE